MIHNLRRQRSARTAPTQGPVRSRPSSVPEIRDGAAESKEDAKDELTLKLPMLEAEALRLRQLLAAANVNRDQLRREMDDLRRDRDRWQKLAEQAESKPRDAGQRAWFCGRALPSK
jgi:hypothetical protein